MGTRVCVCGESTALSCLSAQSSYSIVLIDIFLLSKSGDEQKHESPLASKNELNDYLHLRGS